MIIRSRGDAMTARAPATDKPQGQTEVRLTVVVDAETLHELELRAAAQATATGDALCAGV